MDDAEKKAVEERIVEQLKNCFDPEIPVNIYDLGLIYDIQVEPAGDVAIKMTLTAPNCPAAQSLPVQVKTAAERGGRRGIGRGRGCFRSAVDSRKDERLGQVGDEHSVRNDRKVVRHAF